MAEAIVMSAEMRDEKGSNAARRLRRSGWLPASLNDMSGGSLSLKLNAHDFSNMLKHHLSEHLMVTLSIEGRDTKKVLLREVQHHVLNGEPLHADFGEVSMTERMHVTIPLRVQGEPEGVKNQGGVLDQPLFDLEVECLPDDLVESFNVDVSALNVGDSVTVAELNLGERYVVLTDEDSVVATVLAQRVEAETEKEAEAAEPELIKKTTAESGEK